MSPVFMDWSTAAEATGYDVLFFTWTGSVWQYYGGFSTSSSQVNVSGLLRGRYYAWVVVARNAAGSTASTPGYFALS